ncbi:MAG: cytochrome b/b6 domain-containing protein [Rhizobacter sp.]|nr:cytochrome b/b6 domain-containing protein [Rhizobacter sp.]
MNDTPTPASQRILVWDAPVRVFHWLLVLSFFGAWFTAESERWRLVHVTLGYTAGGLVAFRLLWGLVGTRYARFASFVRGPAAVKRYLGALLHGRPEHHTGHNPAGALAIVALLALTCITVALGWATYSELGGDWLEEGHELAGNLMFALVLVHVVAVFAASWLHRENLVRAMVTGRKLGAPQDGLRSAWRSLAALMLVVVLGFWWWQAQAPLPAAGGDAPSALRQRHDDHDHDHDRD